MGIFEGPLRCLQAETESQILGPGLVREIYFIELFAESRQWYSIRLLCITFSRVARALRRLQSGYAEKFDVGQLADTARIGASTIHAIEVNYKPNIMHTNSFMKY